jgi:hypothetical protein
MMTAAFLMALFGYEYYRREQRHTMVIGSLKQGSIPKVDIQPESGLGALITGFFTLIVIAFVLFLTYFFIFSGKMKIHYPYFLLPPVFLMSPYGIAVMLILITRRNLLRWKEKKSLNERNLS